MTVIVLAFALSGLARRCLVVPARAGAPDARECRRIVSLAPSVTETLFALGLGDRVVGVSRYCNFPAEAQTRPTIGGLLDPNFEAIVRLRSDLVVMLVEHEQSLPAFEKLHLHTLAVNHQDIDGILASIPALGQACGAEAKAREIVADIEARIARVREKTAGRPRPRVLVACDRTCGSGKLQDVYVAAGDGHLGRIVELAGGQNAYPGGMVHFPVVASEGILHINPEVIVDIVSEKTVATLGKEAILADWQQLPDVAAVKSGRVYVLDDDHASIPGPGFVGLVERLARMIHPEIDWD